MLTDYLSGFPCLLAGMPSVTLTDLVRMRLQTISFFAVGVLLSAGAVCWLWNGLRHDFNVLPRLRYRGALFGTVLWGLLFLLVLTMISGARELLTPGAWEKSGLTYQLVEPASLEAPGDPGREGIGVSLADRERGLGKLYRAFLQYASHHGGRFPDNLAEIDEPDRTQPGVTRISYGYIPGVMTHDSPTVVAFEHQVYGHDIQLALFSDGEIHSLDDGVRTEIARSVQQRRQREAEAGP